MNKWEAVDVQQLYFNGTGALVYTLPWFSIQIDKVYEHFYLHWNGREEFCDIFHIIHPNYLLKFVRYSIPSSMGFTETHDLTIEKYKEWKQVNADKMFVEVQAFLNDGIYIWWVVPSNDRPTLYSVNLRKLIAV